MLLVVLALAVGVASPPPLRMPGRGVKPPAVVHLPSVHNAAASSPAAAAPPPDQTSRPAVDLSGAHLVHGPNVFSGYTAAGEIQRNRPLPLGKEEEAELVRTALFFIASTDAQRTLAQAAREGSSEDDGQQPLSDYVFTHEELVREMRRAADEKAAAAAAARRRGQSAATEVPCEIPVELTELEFRLHESRGRAAYNKLFLHNQKVVYFEVNKVWPNWQRATVMEKADFLQEGAQGLLRAIRLFDTARGVRFSTYAAWHVRAYVLRAVRDKSHIVRLPQTLQADMSLLRKARYRYAVEYHGVAPSDLDLAEMLQWPTSRVEAALQGLARASATSLDAEGPLYGAPAPLVNRVASEKHDSAAAEDEVWHGQLRATLGHAMAERDPKRTQMTRLKYGLEDGVEWTYPELAARFNLTANVAKGIVRSEVNFLRRSKRRVLEAFMTGNADY